MAESSYVCVSVNKQTTSGRPWIRLLLQLLLLLLNISKNNIETKSWQPLIAAAAPPTDAATAAAVCEV